MELAREVLVEHTDLAIEDERRTAPTPWLGTQRAAAETLRRLEVREPAARDWTLTDESPA